MSQHQWADRPGRGGGPDPDPLIQLTHTHIHTCTHPVLISLLHSTPSLSRIIQTSWQHLDRAGSIPHRELTQDQKSTVGERGSTTKRQLLSHGSSPCLPPPSSFSLIAPGRRASSSLAFQEPLPQGGSRRWSRFVFVCVEAGWRWRARRRICPRLG